MIFSVIVPTYNRVESLRRTLESLFSQQFPDFEIIVVSDGSSDGTHNYLTSLALQGKIKYHHHANSGLAATRKAGLKFATGEFIAFTDDDCKLPDDWILKYFEMFNNTNAAIIGGPTKTGNPTNPFADANDFINNYFKNILNNIRGGAPYLTGNNIAFKKSSLDKVGGPDPQFRMGAEDRDLLFRLYQSGEKILFDSDNIIEHYNNSTFKQFIRHQYVQGRGSYLYYTQTKKTAGKKPPNIPFVVYLGLLFAPFRSRAFDRALIIFSLIILAQISVSLGFLKSILSGKGTK